MIQKQKQEYHEFVENLSQYQNVPDGKFWRDTHNLFGLGDVIVFVEKIYQPAKSIQIRSDEDRWENKELPKTLKSIRVWELSRRGWFKTLKIQRIEPDVIWKKVGSGLKPFESLILKTYEINALELQKYEHLSCKCGNNDETIAYFHFIRDMPSGLCMRCFAQNCTWGHLSLRYDGKLKPWCKLIDEKEVTPQEAKEFFEKSGQMIPLDILEKLQ